MTKIGTVLQVWYAGHPNALTDESWTTPYVAPPYCLEIAARGDRIHLPLGNAAFAYEEHAPNGPSLRIHASGCTVQITGSAASGNVKAIYEALMNPVPRVSDEVQLTPLPEDCEVWYNGDGTWSDGRLFGKGVKGITRFEIGYDELEVADEQA